MRILASLSALLIATSACGASPAEGNNAAMPAGASKCGPGHRPLPKSGLCQREAAALLTGSGGAEPGAMEGCAWMIRETPFATDLLLYRTLRCGKSETAVEFRMGNHMSELVYTRRAGGGGAKDADGKPLVLAQIFAGNPDGRARALWEARDSMDDARAAARCELKPPYTAEGLPGDALIVDVARTRADEREDAVPECGPLGYNPAGGSIDFWRPHQGYAWFFSMGTDLWDVDPGSFTVIRKDDAGAWKPVLSPS
ncbi:MAG: hypothetical protein WDN24_12445 [Sphingomonas sp.]